MITALIVVGATLAYLLGALITYMGLVMPYAIEDYLHDHRSERYQIAEEFTTRAELSRAALAYNADFWGWMMGFTTFLLWWLFGPLMLLWRAVGWVMPRIVPWGMRPLTRTERKMRKQAQERELYRRKDELKRFEKELAETKARNEDELDRRIAEAVARAQNNANDDR